MAQTQTAAGKRSGTPPGFLVFFFVLPVFLLFIFLLLAAMQYKQMKAIISPNAMALSLRPDSPEAEARVDDSLRAFFSKPGGGDTLALNAEQVDNLIRSSRSLRKTGWRYEINLEDTVLVARNSLPAGEMHGPTSVIVKVMGMRGYLNSVMKASVTLKDGEINLVPVSASMNGVDAPVSVLSRKGYVNPREWVEDKAFYDRALSRLAEAQIRGGRLVLVKRK